MVKLIATVLLLACAWPSEGYDYLASPFTEEAAADLAAYLQSQQAEGTTATAEVPPLYEEGRQRRAPDLGKLLGTFVAECQNNSMSWLSGNQDVTVSSATTTQYRPLKDGSGDNSYQVDYTDYFGNGCSPDKDTVLAKYWQHGAVKFHGPAQNPSKLPGLVGVVRAEYIPAVTNFTFPTALNDQMKEVLATMNALCPCGGAWKAGVPRTIKAGSCNLDRTKEMPSICYIADGTVGWANYKWAPTKVSTPTSYLISTRKYDQNSGAFDVPDSLPRYNLPSGGNTNPANCNPLAWFECGSAISESENFCKGCIGLECEGCLFRYQEQDITDPNRWTNCCPCDYYYQGIHQWDASLKWMGQLSC